MVEQGVQGGKYKEKGVEVGGASEGGREEKKLFRRDFLFAVPREISLKLYQRELNGRQEIKSTGLD